MTYDMNFQTYYNTIHAKSTPLLLIKSHNNAYLGILTYIHLCG